MKHGDFTTLAKDYIHRTGYSPTALKALAATIGARRAGFTVADVGAGTGKLTQNLLEIGLRGYAVEPNDAMREEGIRLMGALPAFTWQAGSAEATGLPDDAVDWVLMGSSFHWPDTDKALREFHRILRPGGHFTALWNPRHLEKQPLHARIEARIRSIVPDLKRVSSGTSEFTGQLDTLLLAADLFEDLLYVEAPHHVRMTTARYLGAWRSVNDIQVQAGPDGWQQILTAIEEEVADLDDVLVPYRTRSWTVRVRKSR
jgi:ubiquinone/menaquinone biosynthesis C-methylase UbiE